MNSNSNRESYEFDDDHHKTYQNNNKKKSFYRRVSVHHFHVMKD